jgi:membrane-bound serine protease (ClpP class)
MAACYTRPTLMPFYRSAEPRARLLVLAALAPLLLATAPAPRPPAPGAVFVISVHSILHPVAAEFIADALARADAAHAAALVIQLDTPGGLSTSMREAFTAMLSARTPVVVYVAPSGAEAASAGFFLLMAGDVAAMAPGTNAGAAHPVGGQGEAIDGTLGKKIEQDFAATIRSLAARSGRNAALAEEAVVLSRSFTADEALAAHLIDLVAPSLPRLLAAIDGRVVRKGEAAIALHTAAAPLETLEMSPLRRLLGTVADPNIAYLLLTLGSLGLFFELMHPGAVLPGVVGGIGLVLGFYALSVLPVNYAGLALLALALLFFFAEIKTASHGVLGAAGIVALVFGSLMLFKSPEPAMRVSRDVIASLSLFTALVVGFLAWRVVYAARLPVRTGAEGLLHEHGTARTPLAPRGKVFVHGEIWDAVAEEPVAGGEPVEVVAIEDFILRVRPRRPPASWSGV